LQVGVVGAFADHGGSQGQVQHGGVGGTGGHFHQAVGLHALADVVRLGQVLVLLDGGFTGGAGFGHHGLADEVGGGGIAAAGLHHNDLGVLGVGLGAGGVRQNVIGERHAVPDAVDALGVQLHDLGIPVDLHELRLHAQLLADGGGQ